MLGGRGCWEGEELTLEEAQLVKRADGTPGMGEKMNVTVKGCVGVSWTSKASCSGKDGGLWSLGLRGCPLHLSPSAGCLCGVRGWDASDSGTFLLLRFCTQPSRPRGEGNGRAQEVCLARPPVQPGLGTLPKAPETMPGMEAGLAGGRPREGAGAASTPFTALAPSWHGGSQHHPRFLGSLPGAPSSVHPPLGKRLAMPFSQKAPLLPSLGLTLGGRTCMWTRVYTTV